VLAPSDDGVIPCKRVFGEISAGFAFARFVFVIYNVIPIGFAIKILIIYFFNEFQI
jgi:hypothetical protein